MLKFHMIIPLLLQLLSLQSTFTDAHSFNVRWILAELKSFELTNNCLVNELCRAPKFKTIIKTEGENDLSSLIMINVTAQVSTKLFNY